MYKLLNSRTFRYFACITMLLCMVLYDTTALALTSGYTLYYNDGDGKLYSTAAYTTGTDIASQTNFEYYSQDIGGKKALVLKDFTFETTAGTGLQMPADSTLLLEGPKLKKVKVKDANPIQTPDNSYALYCPSGTLTIGKCGAGSAGTLSLESGGMPKYSGVGLYAENITIWNGVTINATGVNLSGSDYAISAGIYAGGTLLNYGSITATGGTTSKDSHKSYGVYCPNLMLENCYLTAKLPSDDTIGSALSAAPALAKYIKAIASAKADGSEPEGYQAGNNNSYKYYKAEPTSSHNHDSILVMFNPCGGTVEPSSAFTYGSGNGGNSFKLPSLPTPARNGYKFLGWFTAESGGDKVDINKVYSESTTLYAHWLYAPLPSNSSVPSPSGDSGTLFNPPIKPVGIAVPIIGGKERTTTPISISDDTVTLQKPLDSEMKALAKAAGEKNRPIVVALGAVADSCTKIDMPSNIIAAAGDAASGVKGLKIDTPDGGAIKFDTTAAGAIAGKATGNVTLCSEMRPVNQLTADERASTGGEPAAVIDLSVTAGGSKLTSLGGGSVEVTTKAITLTGKPEDYKLYSNGVEVDFLVKRLSKDTYQLVFKSSAPGTFILAYVK